MTRIPAVQQATQSPHHCAALPYKGNGNSQGFFDTGSYLDRERVYVCFEWVCEAAAQLGWRGPSAVEALEAEIARLHAALDQQKAENAELSRLVDSIDAIESAGFTARKRRGPSPKKKEVTG